MTFPTSSAFADDALARLPQNAAVLIFVATALTIYTIYRSANRAATVFKPFAPCEVAR